MEVCKYYKNLNGSNCQNGSSVQRVLCQTNILPFVEFHASQKKEKKKKLTKKCIISALPIKYINCFPPSFAFNFFRCGF